MVTEYTRESVKSVSPASCTAFVSAMPHHFLQFLFTTKYKLHDKLCLHNTSFKQKPLLLVGGHENQFGLAAWQTPALQANLAFRTTVFG